MSDNGTQFELVKFQKLCDNLSIRKSFSLVARSQKKGLVEAINKTLKHNLKTNSKAIKVHGQNNS